ncbi:MAG: D-cysteine desulfhydrase family protein [Alphaproteobacteria bacterium]|nr:D-cysteine desulfhydrase family protein [Alphaproteobacteria bacterium]
MSLARFPRVLLGHLPTPLERMDRLRDFLGPTCPTLFVKRDDCTGLATGGNKTRKLEFLMGEALAQGAGAVVTFGAVQSNHARQTAAAAAKLGLACDLILIDMVGRDSEAYRCSGNVLFDQLLGARVHVVASDQAAAKLQEVTALHMRDDRKTYVVPIGGSNPIGSLGYIVAFDEIAAQAKAMDLTIHAIVHGTSSGGTQAGLMVGAALAGSATRIMGVNVYKKSGADVAATVHALALDTMQVLGGDLDSVSSRLHVIDGYQGDAYGVPSEAMLEAIAVVAQTEGLLLDPVYSGKAMAGLIGHILKGKFTREQTVVFLHTGGTAALSAYADAFTPALSN